MYLDTVQSHVGKKAAAIRQHLDTEFRDFIYILEHSNGYVCYLKEGDGDYCPRNWMIY